MKIALINGSPKTSNSASEVLLHTIQTMLPSDADIREFKFNRAELDETELQAVTDSEVLVFAFPLYVDGIPSHLLGCLTQMERTLKLNPMRKIRVYAIVNCGFYEGKQAAIALEMLKNWCAKAGVLWGQGAGIGGGGFLASLEGISRGQGSTKNLCEALKILAGNLSTDSHAANVDTVPNFPRVLYTLGGNLGWRKAIKANGLSARDLDRKM